NLSYDGVNSVAAAKRENFVLITELKNTSTMEDYTFEQTLNTTFFNSIEQDFE
ncbi:29445_t:CDS:1, partial [Racocetra persica]